jgi:hypothetical protein
MVCRATGVLVKTPKVDVRSARVTRLGTRLRNISLINSRSIDPVEIAFIGV